MTAKNDIEQVVQEDSVQLEISSIENIYVTTAECNVKVNNIREGDHIQYGLCWSTNQQPSIEGHKKIIEARKGILNIKLTGLKKGEVYFVRPFVKIKENVVYGEKVSFATNSMVNGVPIEMVYIKGGTFEMGCEEENLTCYGDEFPKHEVTIQNFQMSRYEITTKQYCAFLNLKGVDQNGDYNGKNFIDINDSDCPAKYSATKGFSPEAGKANYPVTEVTWNGAKAFCEWLGGRLPTEAEWEYAAKGGQKGKGYKYAGGNNLDEVAWYKENSKGDCHPVGQKKPNELELYDMSGNVWEWCMDWYGFYDASKTNNPKGPESGSERVLRGGSMNMDGWNCRLTNRNSKAPDFTYNYYGFRCLIPGK